MHVAGRVPARSLGRHERCTFLDLAGGQQATHSADVELHDAHAVGDRVVDVARDPQPLLRERRLGMQPRALLHDCGMLVGQPGQGRLVRERSAGDPCAAREDPPEEDLRHDRAVLDGEGTTAQDEDECQPRERRRGVVAARRGGRERDEEPAERRRGLVPKDGRHDHGPGEGARRGEHGHDPSEGESHTGQRQRHREDRSKIADPHDPQLGHRHDQEDRREKHIPSGRLPPAHPISVEPTRSRAPHSSGRCLSRWRSLSGLTQD